MPTDTHAVHAHPQHVYIQNANAISVLTTFSLLLMSGIFINTVLISGDV